MRLRSDFSSAFFRVDAATTRFAYSRASAVNSAATSSVATRASVSSSLRFFADFFFSPSPFVDFRAAPSRSEAAASTVPPEAFFSDFVSELFLPEAFVDPSSSDFSAESLFADSFLRGSFFSAPFFSAHFLPDSSLSESFLLSLFLLSSFLLSLFLLSLFLPSLFLPSLFLPFFSEFFPEPLLLPASLSPEGFSLPPFCAPCVTAAAGIVTAAEAGDARKAAPIHSTTTVAARPSNHRSTPSNRWAGESRNRTTASAHTAWPMATSWCAD